LVVDWRDGRLGAPGQDVFGELFELTGIESADFPPSDAEVEPSAWKNRLDRSLHEVYVEDGDPSWDRDAAIARYSFGAGQLLSSAEVMVLWDFDRLENFRSHGRPEWRGLAGEDLLSAVWREFLRPARRVTVEVRRWLGPAGVDRIGVHVRATHEAEAQQGQIPLSSYFVAIDRILAERPGAEIVLATDNAEVEAQFRGRYSRLRVRPKWYPRPGEPIHLAADNPDRFRASFSAVVEMMALATCDWLVTRRNSSFSVLARIASSAANGRKIALDPKPPGGLSTAIGRAARGIRRGLGRRLGGRFSGGRKQ